MYLNHKGVGTKYVGLVIYYFKTILNGGRKFMEVNILKLKEFEETLGAKEDDLRKLIDIHQISLAKIPIEEQHIIGGKDDCEECQAVKNSYQEILDFEKEIFGFSRVQGTMTNIIKLIDKVLEMREEE
jgi:esterase/lipase